MKNKRFVFTRVVAGVTVTALLAACGAGSESSDTTERTRNTTLWSATTEPVKKVVFGTQDGSVQYVDVATMSTSVSPTNIFTASPSPSGNTISMVAFDSARSDVIFGGNSSKAGVFLSRMNITETEPTEIYSASSGSMYGGGYDPSSRLAMFSYSNLGSLMYVINSVDEPRSPILERSIPFYAIVHYDGSRAFLTTGSNIREVSVTDPTTALSSTPNLPSTPYDMWGFAKDSLSDVVYGARQNLGVIYSSDLDGTTGGFLEVGSAVNPSSLAVYSDGTIITGTGSAALSTDPYAGALTVIDPTGKNANIDISGIGSGAKGSGVQSVWAVESPISTAPPSVSVDSDGNLVCSDATWRGDLPLSRLSRSPIASARSYTWFLNGRELADESSETMVPADSGDFSCAVIAGNLGGEGQSAQSESVSFTLPVEETTTTLESSGGSEASPVESPVVTVPVAAPATPVVVVTPSLRSAKWTFKGRTVKVTFRKYSGAKKYRLYVRGATRKNIVCKSAKTTVTCTTTTLKKGLNSFSAKALSTSGVTLALSTKTRITK